MIRKSSAAFAGALGGCVDSFNIWIMGKVGISDLTGLTCSYGRMASLWYREGTT